MIEVTKALKENSTVFAEMENAPDTSEYVLPYSASDHAKNISDPEFVYLRILENDKLVGFFVLVLDPDGKSVEFRRIVVSEKGRGIGQAAIAKMERFCRSRLSRSRIWLDVFEYNQRGLHVYEKLGYERYGEAEHEGKRLLLYQKAL